MRTRIVHLEGLALVQEPFSSAPGVLAGRAQHDIQILRDAFLEWENGVIVDVGTGTDWNHSEVNVHTVDGRGRWVLPGFVDSHTHAVFAARETEFSMRIQGATYQEIAAAGGGILNSARALAHSDESLLLEGALHHLNEFTRTGTTALEIKSGYGLTLESERKMLRVVQQLKKQSPLDLKSTFLGLHAVPPDHPGGKEGYVQEVLFDWLPRLVDEGLVDFLDAFIESGYFDLHDLDRLMEASEKWNIPVKVHVNQFSTFGAVPAAVRCGAWSVDHLEVLDAADVDSLKNAWNRSDKGVRIDGVRSGMRPTLPVALPACSHFLKIPYTPARRLIEAGIPIGLASDFNPGSAPCSNSFLLWNLACVHLNMTPEEALVGLTLHGAYALGWEDRMGSISVGKQADFILTEPASSLAYFPYRFGGNHAHRVYKKGIEIA